MIGRSAASGALDLDFSSPRHSARKPVDRIGAAEIDAEFGALDGDLRRRFLVGLRVGSGRRRHHLRNRARRHRARPACSARSVCRGRIGRRHDRFRGTSGVAGVAARFLRIAFGSSSRCQPSDIGLAASDLADRSWRIGRLGLTVSDLPCQTWLLPPWRFQACAFSRPSVLASQSWRLSLAV